ncbi:MAG: hypothetical protein AM324_012670, partial [Candidatus Thorarchaeota archaeon SMTZ1-83]
MAVAVCLVALLMGLTPLFPSQPAQFIGFDLPTYDDYFIPSADVQDFVDIDTSDVDSSADAGTHNVFANQQAGPDSVFDTLQEANKDPPPTNTENDVDSSSSNVDSSSDKGTETDFASAQGTTLDSSYLNITEENTGGGSATVKVGIWTDTSGTHDIYNTVDSWFGVPFNNEISASSIYTQQTNDYDIACSEVGHYLVLYSIHATTDANSRNGYEARITVNDVPVAGSYSSGFSRNTGNDDVHLSGGAIVEVGTSGHYISVETTRRTDVGGSTTLVPNECSLQIFRLDDTWDYCLLSKSTDTNVNSESWLDVTWEVENEEDTGSFEHPHNADDAQIRLKTAGHYLVISSLPI